jgi:hypothetical protein
VDYAGISTVSDVAVVVALFFGNLDGEEQAARVLGVDDALAKASPRSCSGGRARGTVGGPSNRACVRVFLGESSAFRRQWWRCQWVS